MVLAIHNSCIECDYPQGYDQAWLDPVREAIRVTAKANGLDMCQGEGGKFKEDEIISGFESVGYALERKHREVFRRTIWDRMKMWETPAILSSLVDLKGIKRERFLGEVSRILPGYSPAGPDSMPTTVCYMIFVWPHG